MYRGRDRLRLKYELYLCDDGNIWSNKENLLKIGKLIGDEAKTCDEIPNNGCNIADMEIEGRKLLRDKQIFKSFSEEITYLLCPEYPTFHK